MSRWRVVDPYPILMAAVDEAGSQKAFALRHGFAPQYVWDLVHKRRVISDEVGQRLGIVRVWVWEGEEK